MSVKVAAWNVRDGLGNPAEAQQVLENVKRLDADLLAFPEAYPENMHGSDTLEESLQSMEREGYQVYETFYSDRDRRRDRHGLVMASRLGIMSLAGVNMQTRNALKLRVWDPETHVPIAFYGIHLDDRREETRLAQARSLVEIINRDDAMPVVLAGDLNAMHGKDMLARVLKVTHPFTRSLPSVEPGEKAENWHFLKRKISLAQRLGDMATGSVMRYLTDEAGLVEADPDHTATKGPVQLDHILHTQGISASDFEVHDRVTSDHRPITAVIHT